MNSNIKYSLTTRLITIILSTIIIFSFALYVYISNSIETNIKEIEKEQKIFIENRFKTTQKDLISKELKTINLYLKSINGALTNSLYNLDTEIVKNILKNLIQLKSIQCLYLYDNIMQKPFISVRKDKGKIIFSDSLPENYQNKWFIKYNLEMGDKRIGYIQIFLNIDHIINNAKAKSKNEMEQIKKILEDKIENFENNRYKIIVLFSIYLVFIILLILFILNIYMKKPLKLLYHNLDGFFEFLSNPDSNFTPTPYNSNDEFGEITQKLNKSIKSAVKLHKNLSYFMKLVDKNVPIIQCDKDGKFTYISEEFCKLTGYSKYELLGENHGDFLSHKKSKNIYLNYIDKLKESEIELIRKYRKKDGSIVTFSSILSSKYDKDKKIKFTEIMHDITYERELISLQNEMQITQKEILFTIGGIAEERSHETGDHIKRVAAYTELLARYTNLSERKINLLRDASPMHDVGKIAIPDSILLKPGKLTEEEFEIMKTHAQIGYEMLKHSKRPLLKTAAIIARTHHEKFDGSGYPRGLKGKNIHIYGRIVAIADVFDALGSDRVYKKAWEDEKIFEFFKAQSGKHFDPELIEIFFKHKDELLRIRDSYK